MAQGRGQTAVARVFLVAERVRESSDGFPKCTTKESEPKSTSVGTQHEVNVTRAVLTAHKSGLLKQHSANYRRDEPPLSIDPAWRELGTKHRLNKYAQTKTHRGSLYTECCRMTAGIQYPCFPLDPSARPKQERSCVANKSLTGYYYCIYPRGNTNMGQLIGEFHDSALPALQ